MGGGSLYAAFGTRRQLFERVLRRYESRTFELAIADLDSREPGIDAIGHFLRSKADVQAWPGSKHGCLIVNSTVELGRRDAEVAADLRDAWLRLEQAVARAIRRAQGQGDIDTGKDADTLARFCITVTRGLAVDAKISGDRDASNRVVEIALAAIAEPPEVPPD